MTASRSTGAASRQAAIGEDTAHGGFDPRLIGHLWRSARPERALFVTSLLLYIPLTATALALPRLLGTAVDQGMLRGDRGALLAIVALYGAGLVVQYLSQFAQLMTTQIMGQRIIRRLRRQVFAHMQRLDAAFYDRSPVGRLLTRVTSDMESIAELFASGAVTIVGDVVTLVGIVVMMFLWNASLATAALFSVPLVMLVTGLLRGPARQAFRAIRGQTAQLNAGLTQYLAGMGVVQAAVQQPHVQSVVTQDSDQLRRLSNRANSLDASLYALVEAVATAVVAGIIWYGALGAQAEAVTLGVVIGFIEYLQRFFQPLRDLSSKYTLVQSALAAAERAYGVLDEKPAILEAADAQPVARLERELRLERVSFRYRDDTPVLRELSFSLRRGERVALVGPTGAGKTSIARLLVRHYDVTEGAILLDGVDLRELQLVDLRARFAVVLQDVFLFSGTVRENLAFGADVVDDARVWEMAARADALGVLERIGGLDGVVAERGRNLSLGERQILALLRTLLVAPDVLILDEATASVDALTERSLQRAIDLALADRTALVIAHRLSTIQSCDRILVLHQGRLVEQGTHDELMESGCIYPRLYRLQYAAQRGAGNEA